MSTVMPKDPDDPASTCDYPLLITQLPDGVIRVLNSAAEELIGPPDQVIGKRAAQFFKPSDEVDTAISALASGALTATLAERDLVSGRGQSVHVWVWSRCIEVSDHVRGAISLVLPAEDVGLLGADPSRPWRSLAEVVIGIADEAWRILRITSDVPRLLGARPRDLIGRNLRDLLHPDEGGGSSPMSGRLRRPDGTFVEVGLLFATFEAEDEKHICFALIPCPAATSVPSGRVAELERQLRQIADELHTTQAMQAVDALPPPRNLPLDALSSRQWEILSRLLRGQRVATIARELYLSQTTVRNHLSAIFQRFGVHSQQELLDQLRSSD
jgi:DNA-binding CsgD family transcriptional regulator/PAS domain-containing protein